MDCLLSSVHGTHLVTEGEEAKCLLEVREQFFPAPIRAIVSQLIPDAIVLYSATHHSHTIDS